MSDINKIQEKRAWLRCERKLLDSISEKIHKNANTGNYGLTEAERKVLEKLKALVEKCPD